MFDELESDAENEMLVVLAERGCRWSPDVEKLRHGTPSVLVVAQSAAETGAEFAARAGTRLLRLMREGSTVRTLVVSRSEGRDAERRLTYDRVVELVADLVRVQDTPFQVVVEGGSSRRLTSRMSNDAQVHLSAG